MAALESTGRGKTMVPPGVVLLVTAPEFTGAGSFVFEQPTALAVRATAATIAVATPRRWCARDSAVVRIVKIPVVARLIG